MNINKAKKTQTNKANSKTQKAAESNEDTAYKTAIKRAMGIGDHIITNENLVELVDLSSNLKTGKIEIWCIYAGIVANTHIQILYFGQKGNRGWN